MSDPVQRHPTPAECEVAGRGPENYPGKPFEAGGLPDTKEERERFEAYMRGHCWDVGHYVDAKKCYDTTFVRCLFGVWRDRGALDRAVAADALEAKDAEIERLRKDAERYRWLRGSTPECAHRRIMGLIYSKGGADMDAAIDAAIDAAKEKTNG